MKIQLDTNLKTIKVEENVNLKEFIDFIKIILPDGMWKDYILETNVIINWTNNPIVVNPYRPYYPEPYWPWLQPRWEITCAGTDNSNQTKWVTECGIYNISTK